MSKRIIVAGGTGFIGHPLVQNLLFEGYSVVVLSRSAHVSNNARLTYVCWDPEEIGDWKSHLDGAYAVINLCGESIASKKWTPSFKELLIKSRILPTRALVSAIESATKRPSILVNISAVGLYGVTPPSEATETTAPGTDFLSTLCVQWESEARQAVVLGVRVIIPRIGVVLGKDGGILPRIARFFRLYLGGPFGTGKQPFVWVDLEDVVKSITFLLSRPTAEGAYNIVSPDRRTMGSFCQLLGKALHRPSWLHVPEFALKWIMGEMSDSILNARPVSPSRLNSLGYYFKSPNLISTLTKYLQ